MVKRTAVILGVLAMLVVGTGVSWGYTVTQWPVPGIPNATYCGSPCLVGPDTLYLKGPVAPACEPPCVPGVLHGAVSIPFRALGLALGPIAGRIGMGDECCNVPLGDPAYVTAAVPCTPVNKYVAPRCP